MSAGAEEILTSSALSIYADKREPTDSHFRWDSIKKFIYLSFTYSTSQSSFDMFSRKWSAKRSIYHIIILQVVVGMPYMFMDFFIKQYTRKMDTIQQLNPLLRGVTFGLFLLSGLWMLRISSEESDAFRFLLSSFSEKPPWSKCTKKSKTILAEINITRCETSEDIISGCAYDKNYVPVHYNSTSAYANTKLYFQYNNRAVITMKFCMAVIVWGFTFFLATMQGENLLKYNLGVFKSGVNSRQACYIFGRIVAFHQYFKVTFLTTTLGSFVILGYLILATPTEVVTEAFIGLFFVDEQDTFNNAMSSMGHIYGIGFLGVYDFGTMSPFTMIDNCVVIYTICYIVLALIRSWIVGIMYTWLKVCVNLEGERLLLNELIYGVMPLSSEFFYADKMFLIFIYFSLFISSTVTIAMLTLTMSRLLGNEFRSVKYIYIVGVICCTEFSLETFVFVWVKDTTIATSIDNSLAITVVFLSGCKAAIIMWIYGVERFSTDVQYWLGFYPTKFWKGTWLMLPVILWAFTISRISYFVSYFEKLTNSKETLVWILLTILFVAIFEIRTIAKFLSVNNIAGVFSASPKYGPPDLDDRKRRRKFTVMAQQRSGHHNLYDEFIECSHEPPIDREALVVLLTKASPESSLINVDVNA